MNQIIYRHHFMCFIYLTCEHHQATAFNSTHDTCGRSCRASLKKQQANQKRGSWILIRQDKIDLFLALAELLKGL